MSAARPSVRETLYVKRSERLSPHYRRIVLRGDGVERFADVTPGAHYKIFVPSGTTRVRRTYTHRHFDAAARELWIDFALHDAPGPAAAWAARACAGDPLEVAVKLGRKALVPAAASYVLVADLSALAVTATLLESMPSSAHATVVIAVHGPEDELSLRSLATTHIEWVHGAAHVVDRLRALRLPAEQRFAHIAGELRLVRDVRAHLQGARGWHRDELHANSYWKSHATEDESSDERRADHDGG